MPKQPNPKPEEPKNTTPTPAPEAPATPATAPEAPKTEETSGHTPEEPKSGEAPSAPAEAEAGAPSPDAPPELVSPTPMEVSGLNGNPEKQDGLFVPTDRLNAIKLKLREASEARDMWDARARAKEALELLS